LLAEKNSYGKRKVTRKNSYRKERLSRGEATGGTGDLERSAVSVPDTDWLQVFSVEDSVHCLADDPDGQVG